MKQKGCTIWLTGLSGCGKSTIARRLEKSLVAHGYCTYVLDGDNIRHGLNKDLGFSPEDRKENIRRIGEVATLFADSNQITIAAFISPYKADRETVRALHTEDNFIEVHLSTPLEICESRDVKGLYAKARAGEISEFTGIDAPYETPDNAELTINTADLDLKESVRLLWDYLVSHEYIIS